MTEETKAIIGERPVFDIQITYNNHPLSTPAICSVSTACFAQLLIAALSVNIQEDCC